MFQAYVKDLCQKEHKLKLAEMESYLGTKGKQYQDYKGIDLSLNWTPLLSGSFLYS
jgi:hypothetical protein